MAAALPPNLRQAERQSAIMRAVKSKDTSPERAVRRILRQFAPGYRLHRAELPGKPDIVYIGRRRVVFVHGCFWHGHDCARGTRAPKTNADYWRRKIMRNQLRDAQHEAALLAQGWRLLVVWECELKDVPKLTRKLRLFVFKD